MRVVTDTNTVVSRYIVAAGIPARIMAAWRAGRFDLLVSPTLLGEYERVLNYERIRRRHGMTPEEVAAEVTEIRRFALPRRAGEEVPAVIARDPDDDQILACAVAGGADYIVSGDQDLLTLVEYAGIRILSPAAFLALLQEEDREGDIG